MILLIVLRDVVLLKMLEVWQVISKPLFHQAVFYTGGVIIKSVIGCVEIELIIHKASKGCLISVFKAGHVIAGVCGVNGRKSVVDDVAIF